MRHLSVFQSMLADVTVSSGDGLLHQGWVVFIIGICVALLWWCGRWVIKAMGLPPSAFKVWDGAFILIGALVITNFLLGLIGHSFVKL